jgi:two-component system, NtrC family, sensor histidine kinase HydH
MFAKKTVMESNHPPHHLWTRIPPWIFIGAVMVLLPLFGYMTYETIERQKKNSVQLLMEKGAALIRAFEAGTRTGVMGTQWNGFQLQRLLTETAQQPDIDYLLVTDIRGRIIAHNNPAQLGKTHGQRWDISQIIQSQSVLGREETLPNGQKVFEVTSRFMPSGPPIGMGHRELLERFQALLDGLKIAPSEAWIIFIGLNMQSVEKARKEDMVHAIIMGAILLLIGFSGIVFLFLA